LAYAAAITSNVATAPKKVRFAIADHSSRKY
jgi:hypothetical protein